MGTPKVVFLAVILCVVWGVTTEAFKLNSWIPKVFKEGRDPTLMELKEWNSTWIMPNEWNSSWIMSKERNLPLIQPKGMKSPLTMNRPFDRFVPKAVTTTRKTTTSSKARSASSGSKCGHVNTRNRIVGGNPTRTHEYPWQVALIWKEPPAGRHPDTPYCGGSIISNQWILTAAHCLEGETPNSSYVVIGEHITNSNSETSVTDRRNISKIVMHPNHKPDPYNYNDVALIKLQDRIEFNSSNKIAPVCLPPSRNLYKHVDATITGWGNNSEGVQPPTLQEVTIRTMSNAQCKRLPGYGGNNITSNMICAGLAGGKSSCGGDSGGPLVTPGNSAKTFMVQIGVDSWGYGCARPNQPGVYARVTKHCSWIKQTTAGSSTCPKA